MKLVGLAYVLKLWTSNRSVKKVKILREAVEFYVTGIRSPTLAPLLAFVFLPPFALHREEGADIRPAKTDL